MSFGQNQWGDFDQYSLHGVDFGADYSTDYGITPTNLQGSYEMNGYHQQMGIVPQGMGGYHDQLGGYHHQMGAHRYQLGGLMDPVVTVPAGIPVVGGMGLSMVHLAGIAVAGYLAYTQVTGRKLGFMGL